MNIPGPMGFGLGLILPVVILLTLAIVIPRLVFMRMDPTLLMVGLNMLVSGMVLILTGALIFALMYVVQAPGVGRSLASEPISAAVQFLRLGASAGLIWAPVLALVGFGLAQRTEL